MSRHKRGQVALRASIISFIVMALFAIAGAQILGMFGITIGAFRVAGGLLLFWIAFEMIFEKRTERKEKSAEVAITRDHIRNIAAFPLAIPLIAGPGAISAIVLTSESFPSVGSRAALLGVIFVCLLITYFVLLLAERVDRFLGKQAAPFSPAFSASSWQHLPCSSSPMVSRHSSLVRAVPL